MWLYCLGTRVYVGSLRVCSHQNWNNRVDYVKGTGNVVSREDVVKRDVVPSSNDNTRYNNNNVILKVKCELHFTFLTF